ncbi:MAG TPA: DUF2314 domain-containing protein [Flavisolibacter sp.]|nr:DUF2314 domain-containing protein [Flavisolibacter sp.]
MKSLLLVFSISFLVTSCDNSKASADTASSSYDIADDDYLYQKTIFKAKDSIAFFVQHYQEHSTDTSYSYMINSTFKQAGKIEYMWSWIVDFEGDSFQAVLNNTPTYATRLKLGHEFTINKNDINDWIIYKNDSVIGGDFIERYYKK